MSYYLLYDVIITNNSIVISPLWMFTINPLFEVIVRIATTHCDSKECLPCCSHSKSNVVFFFFSLFLTANSNVLHRRREMSTKSFHSHYYRHCIQAPSWYEVKQSLASLFHRPLHLQHCDSWTRREHKGTCNSSGHFTVLYTSTLT